MLYCHEYSVTFEKKIYIAVLYTRYVVQAPAEKYFLRVSWSITPLVQQSRLVHSGNNFTKECPWQIMENPVKNHIKPYLLKFYQRVSPVNNEKPSQKPYKTVSIQKPYILNSFPSRPPPPQTQIQTHGDSGLISPPLMILNSNNE